MSSIEYVHTNIVAKDWKKLAKFYIDVFKCEPLYPERDLKGAWIDAITNISNVHIKGIHLKLPGCKNGPTLEIFEYNEFYDSDTLPYINTPGFGHIAFHVDDIEFIMKEIIRCGGKIYGKIVEKEMEGIGKLKMVYTRDLEDNIVEIQHWTK